ncbi:MAG TPA: hypothetical protein VGP70_13840 [Actinomadura sp.]|jgi:hypothetical protein|nr:hypothetical protein [Actinomadura sp.]
MTASGILGVDAGSRTLREADHLLAELAGRFGLPDGVMGCTHLIRTGRPHVAVSLAVADGAGPDLDLTALDLTAPDTRAPDATAAPDGVGAALDGRRRGPAEPAEGAELAAGEHGRTGRAVLYRGAGRLSGTLTVREILDLSAIDRITVLMGAEPAPDTLVQTRGHVRPEWRDGRLTLLTMPAGTGVLAPYEVPDPTPCCSAHP